MATASATALIENVRDLPTPPMVFTQIMKVVDDPNTSAYDIAGIVSEDPGISAKVLRITNSAFYGLSGTVTSIKQAVVIVGLNGIKDLVVSTSVIDMFKGDTTGQQFQELFWRHSLVSAFGCRMLAREIAPTDISLGEMAFTSGLLHDIGKMVMYLESPEKSQQVLEIADQGPAVEVQLERELFGCDHAEVGQMITERWKLPKVLSNAIAHHHSPLTCSEGVRLVDVVHVADALAYHLFADESEEPAAPTIEPAVFERSGFKLEKVSEYLEAMRAEYLQAETFLKMARGGP